MEKKLNLTVKGGHLTSLKMIIKQENWYKDPTEAHFFSVTSPERVQRKEEKGPADISRPESPSPV